MDGRELTTVLLLGVLLPICFSRPPFLREHPMRPHTRARWNFAYSLAAFAAIGFVYVSASFLLRPIRGVTPPMRSALSMAGLLLLTIACAHHVPPLLTSPRPMRAVLTGVLASIVLGVMFGGFLAVDAIFAAVKYPVAAVAAWAVLILLTAGAGVVYSGLSPNMLFAVYIRRRQRRRQHARS